MNINPISLGLRTYFYNNFNFTLQERTVMDLYFEGYSLKEIAGKLHIHYRTAESHMKNIRKKAGNMHITEIMSAYIQFVEDYLSKFEINEAVQYCKEVKQVYEK